MLNFLGLCFKITLMTVLILVLGQLITFGGKSVSDYVKIAVRSVEKQSNFSDFKKEANNVIKKANAVNISFSDSQKPSPSGRQPSSENTENLKAEAIQKVNEINQKEKEALTSLLHEP